MRKEFYIKYYNSHPKYGPFNIQEFNPSTLQVIQCLALLKERGDPENLLPQCHILLDSMARHICRDSAIIFAIAGERCDMDDDVRNLVDMCLPPAWTPDEAFPIWLEIQRRGALMHLEMVEASNLKPDVKSFLKDLTQPLLRITQQQTNDRKEQAMQVVAFWQLMEKMASKAGIPLDTVAFEMGDPEAKEKAYSLVPLDTDYVCALADVKHLPLINLEKQFNQILAKHERVNANPSSTGKNAKYEHEVAESCLNLPEGTPSPLETAPSLEPDPANVVADKDAVEHVLAQFKGRTLKLLRLIIFRGLNITEAARELGINESTARVLLHKARKKNSRIP